MQMPPSECWDLHTRFPSEEAKRLITQGNTLQLPNWQGLIATSSTVYYGWGERWASVRFYRACRDSLTDPLVEHVLMLHDGRMVACAVIDHTFPYWEIR